MRDVDGCWLWAFVYYYNGVLLSALMTKALASDNFLFIWFRILFIFIFVQSCMFSIVPFV